MTYTDVTAALQAAADPARAVVAQGFFKTGPGQYGEGDQFIGVTVPEQRRIAARHRDLPLPELEYLLDSPVHEHRLTALLIMVLQYLQADAALRQQLHAFYLSHTHQVNNWDLVDSSAEYLVGQHLAGQDNHVFDQLAASANIWERRIAMVGCFYDIKHGHPDRAFHVAGLLQHDGHDLIHKAVGWMLREVGKRSGEAVLEDWLQAGGRYRTLPRTMLRYAIERFEPARRQAYLRSEI